MRRSTGSRSPSRSRSSSPARCSWPRWWWWPARGGPASATDDELARAGRASGAERRAARELGVGAERLLDPQQLVVLRHAVRARRRAGLDLAAAGGHREVGDGRVLGLAGP